MTVSTLLKSVDSKEISEWQAYLNLDSYEKRFEQEAMTAKEKTDLLKKTLFRGVPIGSNNR